MSKVKTNTKLTEATKTKSDAGKAGFRPDKSVIKDAMTKAATTGDFGDIDKITERVINGDPWDGKKRLDAGEKMLRCVLTQDEIEARKNELLAMHKQVPMYRQAVTDAKELLKKANTALSAHESAIEMHAAETDRGWINRNVECITVLETRRGMPLRVCYRTDTGEEAIPAKEASADDVQESIPGA